MNFVTRIGSLAFCSLALATSAPAQTVLLSEDFENMGSVPIGGWGPQGLINKGWTFHNNSQVQGPVAWVSGCCWESLFTALSGTGYLAAYQDSAAGGNPPQYSAWAVLPEVPEQQAGDVLTLYTVSTDTYWWVSAHLEIRYSPTGGTSTGTSATNVGDFTDTLLTISAIPNYNQGLYEGWTKWEIELPGPGRIALRQMGTESLYFGVEDLTIAHPGAPNPTLPENFEDLGDVCSEGPCALANEGWIFRDQGTWQAGPGWEAKWPLDEQTPHTGFSFMKSHKVNNPGGSNSGSINTWAILPPITAQDGDVLSFWVRGRLGADGRFQVRFSPSGGTSTGSGPADVGDFTQVLFELDALPMGGWQHVLITLPPESSSGRLALRNSDPHQEFYDIDTMVAIDSMAINPPPYPTPMPQPGQTITWDLAGSPYNINTDLYVPPTSTLMLEPGVIVNLEAQCTLSIGGTVEGVGTRGTAGQIVIQSVANYPPGLHLVGELDLTNAQINTQVQPDIHGSLLLEQCSIVGPNGLIYNIWAPVMDLDDAPPFISINNCQLINANLYPADATLRLTNTTFTGGNAIMNRGYWLLDNLSFTNPQGAASGAALSLGRDQQNVHIDNIHVEGASGPAISVTGDNIGNDYFFGPNNLLVNNGYTAAATGGIVAGSVLPKSGNQVNAVMVAPGESEIRGPVNWHDPGIPYHVSPPPGIPYHLFLEAEVNMHEGVRFQFPPGVAIRESSNFSARGTPENPVRLERLGGGAWWAAFTPVRMEHTVIDGSLDGVVNAVGVPGFYDSCTFSDNGRAMVASCVVNKSQFINNGLGIQDGWIINGQTNPNSFTGNGLAVTGGDARNNWWGHPTGPSGPQNPGGQGDPVEGDVQVIPFRTSPPDFANHPPRVRLQEPYFVVSAGAQFILNWDTIDSDVVSHRVLMSTEWDMPISYVVIADGLPADARSFAVTAPSTNGTFYVRVEAIDGLGQVGWDRRVSYADNIYFDPDLVLPLPDGVPHHTLGRAVPIAEVDFFDEGWMLMDGQMVFESDGAAGVLPLVIDASNDTVRYALVNAGGITFSDYFTVRPDARLGDAAPTVQLLSPAGGSFASGSTVLISWSASDDESVRAVTIQASYDGGLTYHDVRRRLPGTQTSFDWKLPPLSKSISNVKIRVAVEDLRFQMSSVTSSSISLTAGSAAPSGDINGDGIVNVDDLLTLINSWGNCDTPPVPCPPDLTGNGVVNVDDLLVLLNNWSS